MSMMHAHDDVCAALKAKAEELLAAGERDVRVAWDPVQRRAVRVMSGAWGQEAAPKELWTALFAAEAEVWETPRPTAHSIPSRVPHNDPYCLVSMAPRERAALASVSGIADRPRFGRMAVYVMSSVLRLEDNGTLQYAHRLARGARLPLVVLAFAQGDRGTASAARLQCLASVQSGLASLNVPLLCFAGSFCGQTVATYARECCAHVVATDWEPGRQQQQLQPLLAAHVCPVLCFDSSYWCLRNPAATVESVMELCADLMRDSHVLDPLPPLVELPRVVQDMLLRHGSATELFVPPSIVRPLAPLPPQPWRHGIEAAKADLARCIGYLKNTPKESVAQELRDGDGAWSMLRHIQSGSIAPSCCLRTMSSQLQAPQKRRAFQLLVWAREKSVLWWSQQVLSSQPSPPAPEEGEIEALAQNGDALFCAIQKKLESTGVLHPLLLAYWLDGLQVPRIDSARRLLQRFGAAGWSYEVECCVRWELSLGTPRPLEEKHRANLIKTLQPRS